MTKFSIIVAVFNADQTLQRLLDSVRSQTYRDFELIIIDGGSTDNSIRLINKNSSLITYTISEPDDGIYDAWNKGLAVASGEWICFLGADDYFIRQDYFQTALCAISALPPAIKVLYQPVRLVDSSGRGIYDVGDSWSVASKKFKQLMVIPHQGVLHHRDLFIMHGRFDDSFKIVGDYEFLLRHLKSHDAVFMGGDPAVAMQVGGISNNPRYSILLLNEVRRAQKKNAVSGPGLYWMLAYFKVLIRNAIASLFGWRITGIFLDSMRRVQGKPAHWTKAD